MAGYFIAVFEVRPWPAQVAVRTARQVGLFAAVAAAEVHIKTLAV